MPSHQIEMLFLDLAVILLLARALAALAQRVGQPPVIGEILAGIALGPTLFHGSMARTLFPSDIRPLLSALASVGVALFMFTIGLEINHRALRGTGRIAAASAAGSTLVPFLLGLGLAAYLLHAGTADTTRTGAFTVFIALSVSVTAFPVLARILADRRLSTTPLGSLALATAAIVDIAAWIALAALQAADRHRHRPLARRTRPALHRRTHPDRPPPAPPAPATHPHTRPAPPQHSAPDNSP